MSSFNASGPRGRAEISLPAWFGGGKPAKLVADAGLRARVDRQRNVTWIQTDESYYRRKADLVYAQHLAGPEGQTYFDRLATRAELAPQEPPGGISSHLEARRQRLDQTGAPVDAISLHQLQLMVTPLAELPATAEALFSQLREVGMEGDHTNKVFTNAGSHLVLRSEVLLWRVKIASILAQLTQDTRLQEGKLDHLKRLNDRGGLAFQSSSGLYDGLYVFDAYLGPLLGAMSPFVWASLPLVPSEP